MPKKSYHIVALGGTFDHFHAGHAHFLNFAWQLGQHLHLGLTEQKLTKGKPWPHLVQNYQQRKKQLEAFCRQEQISAAISQISDIYGPTLNPKKKIEALVVTEETVPGADKINQARQAMGLKQLPVHICPLLYDQAGQVIRSDHIRAGYINRQGVVFTQALNHDLTLNSAQRHFFSQPHGQPAQPQVTKDKTVLTYVVGDSSLEQFIKNNWPYDLGIYDHRQQRQPFDSKLIKQLQPNLTAQNPAGQITQSLTQALQKTLPIASKKQQHIFVDGEEDLAAAALILLSPLQTQIYYGQPEQGLVMMEVDLALKNEVYQVLTEST